jgi:hypothetical protein
VAQACNPSYLGNRLRRSWFKVSPGKKFMRLHFNQCLGMVAQACHLSYTGKHNWRISIQASPSIK